MPRQTTFRTREDIERAWHHVDADGQVLGRMATSIARILMGKHRPDYTAHVDCGDFVVVTNAEKIVLTGRKAQQRMVKSYSGYPGGLRQRPVEKVLEKHPERVVESAVRRMLPKNRLGRQMMSKLKVYAGAEHPHHAQQPAALAV
ncbi:MAG: 50S ribosomal protein L13 [Phycisphaerales bacterium]|nr:50S ribosomal protein L13 [Phycisphaerales bacterium]